MMIHKSDKDMDKKIYTSLVVKGEWHVYTHTHIAIYTHKMKNELAITQRGNEYQAKCTCTNESNFHYMFELSLFALASDCSVSKCDSNSQITA